jgi:hypothetical protein
MVVRVLWGAREKGVRATAPTEDICCEKMRGCSCSRTLLKARYASIATKVRFSVKCAMGRMRRTAEQKEGTF